MKKLLLITSILLLTGCFGETGQGYITKECIKEEFVNGININTNVSIKSKEGKLVEIKITEKYDGDDLTSIINSKKSEQNLYRQLEGIDMTINNNEFVYTIDTLASEDLVKEKFNIVEEQHEMIKYKEENGYTCK